MDGRLEQGSPRLGHRRSRRSYARQCSWHCLSRVLETDATSMIPYLSQACPQTNVVVTLLQFYGALRAKPPG